MSDSNHNQRHTTIFKLIDDYKCEVLGINITIRLSIGRLLVIWINGLTIILSSKNTRK